MRFLIAAKYPANSSHTIGGVQTWCRTVGAELERRGHEVTHWGPEFHLIDKDYDCGIFANIYRTKAMSDRCAKKIIISHGIIPDETGGKAFTSEEVRDYWGEEGSIIRQPIDLDFWQPKDCKRIYLTRFSYRQGLSFLPNIAQELNLRFQHISNVDAATARNIIQQSALVIATGRAAVEAMACGVPVLIADHRQYQGPLMDVDTTGSMRRNYSGRGGMLIDRQRMTAAIRAKIGSDSLRHHVEQHHNVKNIVDQICSHF